MPGAGYRFTKETVARTRRNARNPNRKRTFTPWPGSGRASNFAGDSAAAERSAGQHAHSHRAFRLVNGWVPLEVDHFLRSYNLFAILCSRKGKLGEPSMAAPQVSTMRKTAPTARSNPAAKKA